MTAPTLAIASGKGGTGKTTVAVNLAVTAARAGARVALVDADVEEPNDHLFLAMPHPVTEEVRIPSAFVDESACTLCGACRDACRFGAVRILGMKVVVFPELCHGCGACSIACLAGAMGETMRRVGEVVSGEVDPLLVRAEGTGALCLSSGVLDVGDVHAPDVIRAARESAQSRPEAEFVVIDASPGVSCSAVTAASGADLLLLVTEPTVFGTHDLALAADLGEVMGIPLGVVVNRARPDGEDVSGLCRTRGIPILGEIPFDREAAAVHAAGGLLVDGHPEGTAWFGPLWESVVARIEGAGVSLQAGGRTDALGVTA